MPPIGRIAGRPAPEPSTASRGRSRQRMASAMAVPSDPSVAPTVSAGAPEDGRRAGRPSADGGQMVYASISLARQRAAQRRTAEHALPRFGFHLREARARARPSAIRAPRDPARDRVDEMQPRRPRAPHRKNLGDSTDRREREDVRGPHFRLCRQRPCRGLVDREIVREHHA